jgi:hypothetical protein
VNQHWSETVLFVKRNFAHPQQGSKYLTHYQPVSLASHPDQNSCPLAVQKLEAQKPNPDSIHPRP